MILVLNNCRVKAKTKSSKITAVKVKRLGNAVSVRVASNDEDMGLVYGSGLYDKGSEVRIWAEPTYGHKFIRWSDGSIEASRTITVNEDIELIAYFEIDSSKGILTYIPNTNTLNQARQ